MWNCALPLSFRPGAKLGWNLGSLLSMCLKALSLGDSVNLRHCDSKAGSPDELGSCFLWILRTGLGPGGGCAAAAPPSGWWCLELRGTTGSWPSGWIRPICAREQVWLVAAFPVAILCGLSCWDSLSQMLPEYCLPPSSQRALKGVG